MKLFRSTLDLDFNEKSRIEHIEEKIKRCKDLVALRKELSPSRNGWHFILWCKKECNLCRISYDDPVRYQRDLTLRERHGGNFLASRKIVRKGEKEFVFEKQHIL